jgi:trigger factor
MSVEVQTLEKLERRITLTVPVADIQSEVDVRLRKLSRTVKSDGFRPGKVPMSVVAKRYGYAVHSEVINDKIGQVFANLVNEAQLRVAGMPKITEQDNSPEGALVFDATFEVFPQVKLGDFSGVEIERVTTEVTEEAVDKTIMILRKQRRTFTLRPDSEPASVDDRVTIDFEGKIDGVLFDGGQAEGFEFVIGEGQMLEQFDAAVRGMKSGESKTFPLQFPEDYQGTAVAGKEADFLVTLKKIEAQQLPAIDDGFVKALDLQNPSVEGLRADIKKNLAREVKARLLGLNRANAMEALLKVAELDVPKALIASEAERMVENFRADLKSRGMDKGAPMAIPPGAFDAGAERRVRLGLVVSELSKVNNLKTKPEQLQAHIEEMAQSYENPTQVVSWYLGNRERMAEVDGVVFENNVADYVFSQAKVVEKPMSFDELMKA